MITPDLIPFINEAQQLLVEDLNKQGGEVDASFFEEPTLIHDHVIEAGFDTFRLVVFVTNDVEDGQGLNTLYIIGDKLEAYLYSFDSQTPIRLK